MKRVLRRPSGSSPMLRASGWVNGMLMPMFGPPPLGPYGETTTNVNLALCPVCGHEMGEHRIDHSTANAILECPADKLPGNGRDEFTPLNELGMPLREPRARRFGR